MGALVIIRTFPADDFIAYLCYRSFKEVIDADYIFFAEEGDYKWITKTGEKILYRRHCGNFGGEQGVRGCIDYLKSLDVSNYDKILLSDSDITMFKNPLDIQFNFGGIKDASNPRHFSGQLLIYTKWVWEKVMNYKLYSELVDTFVKKDLNVADDTIMSWVATLYTDNTFDFSEKGYWRHEKLHHLEPLIK